MDEIEALKEELRQTKLAYLMAVQMAQLKAGFLARTSHELRSPLNSLIGLHQLILSDLCEDPAEEREFIQQAHQSALKLMKLIDKIVDVSKAEYGRTRLEIRPIPLSKIFAEVERLTYLQAANRGFPLQISHPDPELYVMADFRRLAQVLISAIDTSIAHLDEGAIEVSARSDSTLNEVQIWLDFKSSLTLWSEPRDLLEQEPLTITPETFKNIQEEPTPSVGMNLLLIQNLLDVMEGRLEIIPGENQSHTFTRLQCAIPLASPEVVNRELKGE